MGILERRVVAITGGASGIGLAVAERWVADGGFAVLLDLSDENIVAAISQLGAENARGIRTDVTKQESVDAAFASIVQREGRLDGLMNGAGIGRPSPTAETSDADFEFLMSIHLGGVLRASRAAHSLLSASRGAIVNISSVAAKNGMPQRASYCSAKSAIEGFTRSTAVEWAPDGIRVNAVAPGYVRTALTDALIAEGKLNDEPIVSRTPLARFADPQEIAAVVSFLLSPDASFVTGHSLVADGGLTIDGNWY
ncbi:3-oxoacyl-[acyl-carrier protein] reductase [Leucobacter sp. 7(1)]|uniref:SDR family NAD(P)-dependent oxidoreductase n=1 Tax=Leucobacter sp. 7(1) TaxID=1255613 RepID=UPI00097EF782|nr:SDR family oxidoreductase [Leucobacter sp. 7(1)]SJN09712.1 3-oxoacyl-[acyl-carrier protein] reductase [Leucobacter sp. 7(1)]